MPLSPLSYLAEQATNSDTPLGLATALTCFPSFHPRLASFTPGLDRVLLAIHRKLLHSKRRGDVDDVHVPLVPVLAHLMLHFIDEWEVFALLSHLLARTAWLDCSKAQCAASHSTLLQLLHSHAVSTLQTDSNAKTTSIIQVSTSVALQRIKPEGVSLQIFLEELTRNWFLWPFYMQPFWMTVSPDVV